MTPSTSQQSPPIPESVPEMDCGPIDPQVVARVLTDVAATASETLELQDVFHRVATSVRELIPFDHMGVIRVLEGDWAVMHATTLSCPQEDETACSAPCALATWSPRMRPRPGFIHKVDDAEAELDPAFPGDAEILRAGVGSALWQSFSSNPPFRGGVWLSAYAKRAFTEEHQRVLKPVAAILGSAVEHWRIWDAERNRRERLDRIEALFGTLAESLDIREVFVRLSKGIQPILEHDLMALMELDVRSRSIRLVACSGSDDMSPPVGSITLTEEEIAERTQPFQILQDIPAEVSSATGRGRLLLSTGMRSWLRVPVRMSEEIRGSLGFLHLEPSRYSRNDVEVAIRLADRVALMLSHQRLADEARTAADARERAERLEATIETLTREMESRGRGRIVGISAPWKEALRQVGLVAPSETTALITGESGTGKEVLAHLIHQGSPRAAKPFVAINCAALPEHLLESELLGHEKGAFTGAIATKIGRIEQAAGGTLFLDEIGEMSPLVQAKFLRVLQEREFQRVGGTRTIRTDVRVIAATNRDLEAAIGRQDFREDLYYRLNVFQIHIPPLRERPEDILPMAEGFLEDLGRTMGRPAAGISLDARGWLVAYPWPGNVRELRNAIERAILLCGGGLITREHLPAAVVRGEVPGSNAATGSPDADPQIPPGGVDLDAVERGFVEKALRQAKGNKSRAARLLGLSRAQFYSRLEKHRIRLDAL
jgi:Nif-specific regulatory protein